MARNVIAKLQGGLGNQLFQYAFARKIQEEIGAKLILDTSDFIYDKAGRNYALEPFKLNKEIIVDASGKYNWKYDQRKNWLIKAGVKLCPEMLFHIGSYAGIYIWEDIKYKNVVVNNSRTVMLHGLWQSEKYFYDIREQIKKEINVTTPMTDNDKKLVAEMRAINSVCVHIRRGDFLKNSNNLSVCHEKYYLNAMEFIEDKVDNPIFYIFSDDILDVKNNFKFLKKRIIYVEGKRNDYEEFRLMYNCKHFIISNSTFSWWSSYLGGGDGIVIAPKKWYEDNTDVSNLIREDMLCM